MGDPETLHQIKLIAKNVQLLEDLLYSHNHRHVYNGQDTLFGLHADMVEYGIFDLDRIPTPLKSKILSEVFTAGADITAGQVVAITGDNEVSPADNTLRSQAIGVALNDAAVGEQVEVIIYGKTTVVADGVISAGDPLAAATTTGRVVSLLSHSHTNPNTSSVDLAHTHTNPNTSATGSHTHTNPDTDYTDLYHRHTYTPAGTINAVSAGTPSGSISFESAGTPSGNTDASGTHAHGDFIFYDSSRTTGETEGHTHSHGDYWLRSMGMAGIHFHSFTGDALAGHNHTFTGSALSTHSHTFTGSSRYTSYWHKSAIGHRHTQASTGSAGTHVHTQGSTSSALGSHLHTQGDTGAVNNAQIVGKALTAAAGAGVEIEILVCLAG